MKNKTLTRLRNPEDIEKWILLILTKKKRSMTSKQIADELKRYGFSISRPTIARYLMILREKRKLREL